MLFTRAKLLIISFSLCIPYSTHPNVIENCKKKICCLKNNKEECLKFSGWSALAIICGIASITATVGGICCTIPVIQKKFTPNETSILANSNFDGTVTQKAKPPLWWFTVLGLIVASGLGYASWKASLKAKEKWNIIIQDEKR